MANLNYYELNEEEKRYYERGAQGSFHGKTKSEALGSADSYESLRFYNCVREGFLDMERHIALNQIIATEERLLKYRKEMK